MVFLFEPFAYVFEFEGCFGAGENVIEQGDAIGVGQGVPFVIALWAEFYIVDE